MKKILSIFLALSLMTNCVSTGRVLHDTGKTITAVGGGCMIIAGVSIITFPLAIVPGLVPCIVVGVPMWELGGVMSGQKVDSSDFGL